MFKYVLLAVVLAYAYAAPGHLIATPVVAHSVATSHQSVVHHHTPVVHTHHVVPVVKSVHVAPVVHAVPVVKTVHAVHTVPVVRTHAHVVHASPVLHHAPLVHLH